MTADTMASRQAAVLQSIITEPNDDFHRLVYADLLEEDDQEAQAEFIRVQCALAQLPVEPSGGLTRWSTDEAAANALREEDPRRERLLRRERELLAAPHGWRDYFGHCFQLVTVHGMEWYRGAHMIGVTQRGFVHSVISPADRWLAHADAITAAHPVREVKLTSWPVLEWRLVGVRVHINLPGRVSRRSVSISSWNDYVARNDMQSLIPALLQDWWPNITFTLPREP